MVVYDEDITNIKGVLSGLVSVSNALYIVWSCILKQLTFQLIIRINVTQVTLFCLMKNYESAILFYWSCLDGAISYSRSLHARYLYLVQKVLYYLIFYLVQKAIGRCWIIYFKLSYVLSCLMHYWLVLDRYSIQRYSYAYQMLKCNIAHTISNLGKKTSNISKSTKQQQLSSIINLLGQLVQHNKDSVFGGHKNSEQQ